MKQYLANCVWSAAVQVQPVSKAVPARWLRSTRPPRLQRCRSAGRPAVQPSAVRRSPRRSVRRRRRRRRPPSLDGTARSAEQGEPDLRHRQNLTGPSYARGIHRRVHRGGGGLQLPVGTGYSADVKFSQRRRCFGK